MTIAPTIEWPAEWRDQLALSDRLRSLALWPRMRRHFTIDDQTVISAVIGAPLDVPMAHIVPPLLCADGKMQLRSGAFAFHDLPALWTIMEEILGEEAYFFTSDRETPVIIDGGTNVGLSCYYFKSLFPQCQLTGFEPVPVLHGLACANMKNLGFDDVVIHRAALGAVEGETDLFWSPDDSLAGSLSLRDRPMGNQTLQRHSTPVMRLAPFLDREVDLLKLDIEGAEIEVIKDCQPYLQAVRNICIEYHEGAGLPAGRLGLLLSLLGDAGFTYRVARMPRRRPLTAFGPMWSAMVYARRY